MTADHSLTFDIHNADKTLSLNGNLTVESASILNQDLSSDATPTFPGITNASADLIFSTTTSGDVELNPVSTIARVMGATANNSGNKYLLFGSDDTTDAAGIRTSTAGAMEYKDRAGAWTAIAAAATANQALSNLSSVAINTTLVSDANNTDDLGTVAYGWREGFINKITMDSVSPNTFSTSIKSHDSATASVVYSLPPADGAADAVLSTSGSAVMSWVARAKTDLSNLGTTAINAHLIPASNNTYEIGSSTGPKEFATLYARNVITANAALVLQSTVGNVQLTPGGSGIVRFDANTVPNGNNSFDVGADANEVKDVWAYNLKHDQASVPLTISTTGNNGDIQLNTHEQGSILLNGLEIYKSNLYLASTDFPNITTLYHWRAGASGFTTVYGSKDLTEGGTLSAANDHLANSVDCDTTAGYGYSSDAVFDMTGDFSLGCWVYLANWADNTLRYFMTKRSANGWIFYKTDVNTINFFRYGGATDVSFNCSSLSSGFHHLAFTRDSGTSSSLYIDGSLVSRTTSASTITDDGDLEIGSVGGGSGLLAGRITEITVHNGTIWSSEEVKKIYARGSRLLAAIKPDNNIDMQLPLEGKWFNYTPTLSASGSMTCTLGSVYNAKYCIIGNLVTLKTYVSGTMGGTAGISIYQSLPITTSNTHSLLSTSFITNNSVAALSKLSALDAQTLDMNKIDDSNYVASGTSYIRVFISYEIA
jgi:hypothetical protein